MNSEETPKLAVFEGRQIRKALHEGAWWFSIIDVVEALVGGERPRKYWNDLKKKLLQEGYDQLSEKIGQLKMQASDGKLYAIDCANSETLFRIIQSIPSPKVEPLKRWLAKVGKERLDEIENPELAMGRMQYLYEKKGQACRNTGRRALHNVWCVAAHSPIQVGLLPEPFVVKCTPHIFHRSIYSQLTHEPIIRFFRSAALCGG